MSFSDLLPFLAVGTVLVASYGYYCLRTGVPTFPSMPVARDKITALLQADCAARSQDKPYKIYDLGAGSGQLSWHIARAMPQAQIIGIELSFVPWLRATIWQKLTRQQNLRYLRVNFWNYPIADADAVLTYLMEAIMPRVSAKLRQELRPQTMVISNKFPLPEWEPIDTFTLQSAFSKKLLVYRQASPTQNKTVVYPSAQVLPSFQDMLSDEESLNTEGQPLQYSA
jgi:trans-aconitate methyltransferase